LEELKIERFVVGFLLSRDSNIVHQSPHNKKPLNEKIH
jgi:hypothetical protein